MSANESVRMQDTPTLSDPQGAAIVAEARSWIGTPYRHQASVKGAGCDCLGLVRGVWRALLGPEPEPVGPYSRDWAEAAGAETLLAAAGRHLVPVAGLAAARPGDVAVFRLRAGAVAKHAGILVAGAGEAWRMVHAQEKVGVVEVHLGPWWRRRIAGLFRFPLLPGAAAGGAAIRVAKEEPR